MDSSSFLGTPVYVSHFDVKALALLKAQLHFNKNTKLNEFPKTRI
jgi:hypothetical protein